MQGNQLNHPWGVAVIYPSQGFDAILEQHDVEQVYTESQEPAMGEGLSPWKPFISDLCKEKKC